MQYFEEYYSIVYEQQGNQSIVGLNQFVSKLGFPDTENQLATNKSVAVWRYCMSRTTAWRSSHIFYNLLAMHK